jgi:hypothetical protein
MATRWIFADFKPLSDKDLRVIEQGLYTDVVLGVSNGDKPWSWKGGQRRRWRASIKDAMSAGLRVHLMPWMRRDKVFIQACMEAIVDLFDEMGLGLDGSILIDAEFHWIHGRTPIEAASELIRELAGERRLGVTGYTKVTSQVGSLLEVCDYGCAQAYGFWQPSNPDHWSRKFGSEPGRPQQRAFRHWSSKPLVMALAAYWLKRGRRQYNGKVYRPMTQREAWVQNLDSAMAPPEGVDAPIAYADWSLKHLHRVGKRTAPERLALARATSELVLSGRRGEILR